MGVRLMDRERLRITYERKSRDSLHGRFGGGWQWKLGFQAGGRSVIVNLLIANVHLEFRNPRSMRKEFRG